MPIESTSSCRPSTVPAATTLQACATGWHSAAGVLPAGWRVQVLSGVGGKQPAAIVLRTPHWLLLLDAGASLSPDPTSPCEAWVQALEAMLDAAQPLDAMVFSHDHVDHIGAQSQLPVQIPRYATPAVMAQLPPACQVRALPLCGVTRLSKPGAPVLELRTGANGHSVGGVWIHLSDPALPEASVWYSGDISLESSVLRVDLPPPAALALVDASYGLYDHSLSQGQAALAPYVQQPLVLPVPPSGRLLEMMLWLQSAQVPMLLDSTCRCFVAQALHLPAEQWVPGAQARLHRLWQQAQASWGDSAVRSALHAAQSAAGPAQRSPVLFIADPGPDGRPSPLMAGVLADATRRHAVVYTGYCPHAPEDGSWYRGPRNVQQLRWNVHPRRRDLAALLSLLQPRDWCPLFTAHTAQQLVPGFQPAGSLALHGPRVHPVIEMPLPQAPAEAWEVVHAR